MKETLNPEEILAFFVLSNLNKNYSIKQFLRDRERARSTFRNDTTNTVKTKTYRAVREVAIGESQV